MMISVTRPGGTATKAAVKGYDVAGKTGTSHKYIEGKGYSSSQYYASFAGFVPAHRPQIVMVVATDNPKGSHFGGTVSAPVFSRTAERVLKMLNVPPDHPEAEPEKKTVESAAAKPAEKPVAKPVATAKTAAAKPVAKPAAKPDAATKTGKEKSGVRTIYRPAAAPSIRPKHSSRAARPGEFPPMAPATQKRR